MNRDGGYWPDVAEYVSIQNLSTGVGCFRGWTAPGPDTYIFFSFFSCGFKVGGRDFGFHRHLVKPAYVKAVAAYFWMDEVRPQPAGE